MFDPTPFKMVLIPIISGFIGYGTNAIAVMMLFRPHQPFSFLGITVHGLIPRRKRAIAEKIGEIIEKDILSVEELVERLMAVDHRNALEKVVSRVVQEKFKPFILKKINFLSGMLPASLFDEITRMGTDYLERELPGLLKEFAKDLPEKMDIKNMVVEKIVHFDSARLEEIILKVAARELKGIEILGGILGFLVGILQVFFLNFLNILAKNP